MQGVGQFILLTKLINPLLSMGVDGGGGGTWRGFSLDCHTWYRFSK